MPITTLDQLLSAMGNASQQLVINKATMSGAAVGLPQSLWRVAGTPGLGAIPTTAAICTAATAGAFVLANAGAGTSNYLARAVLLSSLNSTDVQFHDRLLHMGGLSGTLTSLQTVSMDASVVGLDARRGSTNYSDLEWWLEWYGSTGVTSVNINFAVTYDDLSTGTVGPQPFGVSTAVGRMSAILPGVSGLRIRSIQSATLTGSSGTAGNFGVTCTRALASVSVALANNGVVADWSALGFPLLYPDTAITLVVFPSTTSTGILYGSGKVVTG